MKRKMTYLTVMLLCVALLAVAGTAGWLSVSFDFGKQGSVRDGYFAAGDGSAANPYIITDQYHMYNLAWLQYYGTFDGRFPYFKVQTSATDAAPAAIDMARLTDDNGRQIALPPIGTEAHPFRGQFNGNRSTISNLAVSVAAGDLAVATQYDFGKNLGMFGTVKAPAADAGQKTKISDFSLDGVTVATQTFASTVEPSVGLVAGSADTEVVFENVGVVKGKITAAANNRIASKRALIGSVGEGGSGDQGGDDLIIDPNKETVAGITGFAPVTGAKEGYAYYSKHNDAAMDFVTGESTSGLFFHPSNNGTFLKLDQNLYTFADYTPTNDYADKQFVKKFPNGDTSLGDKDRQTYQLLNENIVAKYGENGTEGIGKQKILFSIYNGLKSDANNLVEVASGVKIPRGGVYFKPMISGKVSVLVYAPNPSNFSVGLFKLRRPSATDFTSVSGIERISEFVIESGQVVKPTAYNDTLGYDNALDLNNIDIKKIANVPQKDFYFLFEEEVHVGEEYVIGQSNRYQHLQTTFVYLMLPAVNQQGGSGLTGIDFVTSDSPMWAEGYVSSGTGSAATFEIAGTAAGEFTVWFMRSAATVLYYYEGGGVTVTPGEPDKVTSSADAKYDVVLTSFADGAPPGRAPPDY